MKYWPEDFYHYITFVVYQQYKYCIPSDDYHHIKLFSKNWAIMVIMVLIMTIIVIIVIMVIHHGHNGHHGFKISFSMMEKICVAMWPQHVFPGRRVCPQASLHKYNVHCAHCTPIYCYQINKCGLASKMKVKISCV